MVSYISKLLTLTIFSWYSIFLYYSIFTHHIETIPWNLIIYNKIPVWLLYYLIPLVIIYGLYKLLSYYVFNDPENETIEIKYTSMIFYWLLNLFLLCIVFFSTKSWFSWSQWISLFFKILWFLILPLIIFLSSFWFWNKILWYVKWYEQEDNSFKFLSSIWLWFYFFLAIFYILAFLWLYNSTSFLIIIILFLIIWYKNLFFLLKNLFLTKIKIDKDINLYTSEFLFIIISALISTNLILVFRPFPIWWDDLWVYMNFPHLLATAWELLPLWWMQTWEIYTWIWYLFWSATQAFYLNSFSWILASIFIYLIAKSFFYGKKWIYKYSINYCCYFYFYANGYISNLKRYEIRYLTIYHKYNSTIFSILYLYKMNIWE